MARAWAFLRVVFGWHELTPESVNQSPCVNSLSRMELFRRFAQAAGRKIREGWKAVVALATPIVLAAASDLIDVVADYVAIEYGTSVWVGVVTAGLVWLKGNVEPA